MGKRPLFGLLAFLVVVGIVFLVPWTSEASTNRVRSLEALCKSRVGLNRKCIAVSELLRIDSRAARDALGRLADNADDRTATLALSALGREGSTASKRKLTLVLGAARRTDAARAAALSAWCCAEKERGQDWADVREFVEGEVDGNQRLEDALTAVKGRLFEGGE